MGESAKPNLKEIRVDSWAGGGGSELQKSFNPRVKENFDPSLPTLWFLKTYPYLFVNYWVQKVQVRSYNGNGVSHEIAPQPQRQSFGHYGCGGVMAAAVC